MKRFKSAWRKCNLKKRISDEAVEAAFPCNINYLLHLFFIIGVQRIYEETVFSMEISGSAECYRVLLGCARYPTVAEFFRSFTQLYSRTSEHAFPCPCLYLLSKRDTGVMENIANTFINEYLPRACSHSSQISHLFSFYCWAPRPGRYFR